MTCRVLSQLPLASELQAMFCLCLDAEMTEATITDYRSKLQYLQKLSFETTRSTLIRHPEYHMVKYEQDFHKNSVFVCH